MTPAKRLIRLKKIISDMQSVLIAFSGGLDSSFLLKVASLVLPRKNILAVTASSPTYPKEELAFSKKVARQLGVRHKIVRTGELKDKRFANNPVNRCYFCKKELFRILKKEALKSKSRFVIDATNASDRKDLRPGRLAKIELEIRSPLEEAGITKEEIRILSKQLNLSTWDKPSLACLASRIPYGTRIRELVLRRVNQAESYLKRMGFRQVRLRDYGDLCRIELLRKDNVKLVNKSNSLIKRLKRLGYNYITLDLEGYRTGSMNEVIKK